ncbi:zinc finger protein 2 homolog isoform X2 [Rhagoletis pomonella]|uniref:zinc finger protein 2 homolog isoform X2 n=1 Tax=Rhagoletis pomonella TaxID=28610 RepID=UPI0017856A66|nr:zinc finger protein 2 homolog isoform X2 [Rhagoletis pomonella]
MQCRACMQKNYDGFVEMSYAVSADGKTLYDYFNECTQLQATNTDNLPKLLCLACTQSLRAAYNFRQGARRSDEELRNILEGAHFGDYLNQSIYEIEEVNLPLQDIKTELTIEIINELDAGQLSNVDSDESIPYESENGNDEFSRATHICEFCECSYTTQNKLKDHILNLHKDEITCTTCQQMFEMPRELKLHKELVHMTESPVACPWCRAPKFIPKEKLTKHMQTRHKRSFLKYFPRINVCSPDTDELFQCERFQEFLQIELADNIQEHTFECVICSKSFKEHSAYKTHIKSIHNSSICSKEDIPSKDDGKLKNALECSVCLRKFKLERTFELHMRTKHKPDSVKKNNPSARAKRDYARSRRKRKEVSPNKKASRESRHAQMMTEGKKYLCSICPREFNSETSVNLHEKRVHLSKKPKSKECPICHKKFDRDYFKQHIQNVHTSERKFVCDICDDGFKSSTLLQHHKLLHFERKFPCNICTKKFIRSSDLKVHMRSHTGEEPFECHLCDRRFKIKVKLNYHLQQHAGIKRKCAECGKEFNNVRQLKIHSYKHTGMPYRCLVCDYSCVKREVFRHHLSRMHNMTITPDEYRAMFKANTGRNPYVKPLEELLAEEQKLEYNEQ